MLLTLLAAVAGLQLVSILFQRRMLMDVATLLAKIATLQASVDALPAATPPVDLQPVADAIDAVQASVNSKLPPAP